MKITKFVHSCLLIEELNKKVLIDPGNYSEQALDLNTLSDLSYFLITHEHQDHMYLPLIKKILKRFPEVKIISNQSVAEVLGKEGVEVTRPRRSNAGDLRGLDDFIKMEGVPHEKVFGSIPPQNVLFTVNGKLTHPGDSHSFSETTEILALPIQAPWGSTTAAVNLAERLKPKIIIPIHDWHWNNEARDNMYKRLEEYFEKIGIKFIGLESGKEIEV